MEEPLSFNDLLLALSPLLAALWFWGLGHVLRDLRRVSATRPASARCGLPESHPLPTQQQRWLASRRSRPPVTARPSGAMTWWGRVAPRSAREVWALVMLRLIIWFGVALTVTGLAALSMRNTAPLGLAGTLVILCGGFAWARRFRHR